MSDAPLTQADERQWWLALLSSGQVVVVTPTPGDRSWCVVPKARRVEVERELSEMARLAFEANEREKTLEARVEEYREALARVANLSATRQFIPTAFGGFLQAAAVLEDAVALAKTALAVQTHSSSGASGMLSSHPDGTGGEK